jgi:hypothetical protein
MSDSNSTEISAQLEKELQLGDVIRLSFYKNATDKANNTKTEVILPITFNDKVGTGFGPLYNALKTIAASNTVSNSGGGDTLQYEFVYSGQTENATGFTIERLASFGEDGFAAADSIDLAIVSLQNASDGHVIQYYDGTDWIDAGYVYGNEYQYSSVNTYALIKNLSLSDGDTLKVRVKDKPASEKNIVLTLDDTKPAAPTHTVADDDSDNVSNAVSGSEVSVTGEANADVYLIRNDGGAIKSAVIDKIAAGEDLIALANLFALEPYEYSRSTLGSDGSGTIATDGLIDGTYELYQVDRAGNVSVKSTVSIAVDTDITSANYIEDVDFASITYGANTESNTSTRGGDANHDNDAAIISLDLNDVTVGDVVELYIDGKLAYLHSVTDGDKQNGKISTDQLSLNDFDKTFGGMDDPSLNTANDVVVIEVKVKHDGRYVQDGADVTWEYQW